MWKKTDRKPLVSPPDSSLSAPVLSDLPGESAEHALIGEAHVFKGEVSGGQDLTINGRFEGTVSLSGHTVTVGRNGRMLGACPRTWMAGEFPVHLRP
jgi:cytoskeletal protein CcmA (bactofilin family)